MLRAKSYLIDAWVNVAASDLGFHYFSTSHKKNARLIRVKMNLCVYAE